MTTKQQQRENSKWVTYDLQKITNPMKKINYMWSKILKVQSCFILKMKIK